MEKYSEYKVILITESGCSSIFLGSATLPVEKVNQRLNKEAKEGWQVVFQVIEKKRTALFWSREALLVTLGR
ncbi:MAG: DUF4177 domain-containing protein [Bacteroidales bacterium]|nr:DUF4177 domain-containing protein [Bacteroidales bacterium]MCF8336409.1 DUF4177 domain-containing protein [Bacteroidales bacterium]